MRILSAGERLFYWAGYWLACCMFGALVRL